MAAGALPAVFLAFALTALPWRVFTFYQKRWLFFTLDVRLLGEGGGRG
jgi:hypothetical protein